MPPRYAYWTILAGGLPTAFRAAERDDLLPTFQRIREKHPDAEMKWFARGKLWSSPEEAQQAREQRHGERPREGGRNDRGPRGDRREGRSGDRRPPSGEGGHAGSREPRDRNWRPGGEHRDPRQKYKDAKKERNLEHRKERFARKHGDERPREERPRGEWKDRERKPAWTPREKPHGDKLLDRRPAERTGGRPKFGARDDRGPRQEQPRGNWRDRPREERPSEPRPRGDWRDRPPREKPHGDKLRPQSFRPRDDRRPGGESRPPGRNTEREGWRRERPQGQGGFGASKPRGEGGRPFERKQFDRKGPGGTRGDWRDRDRSGRPGSPGQSRGGPPRDRGFRGGGTDEPPSPPRPRGPNREPRPSEEPPPQSPPRPSEPSEPPSGPPERGRPDRGRGHDRSRGGNRGGWKDRGRR